jgi:tetratricopeptide (TPR) repeat protein
MSPHVDRATLLAYIDGDSGIDRQEIAAHLAACTECRRVLDEAADLSHFGRDVLIFRFLSGQDADPERERGRQGILAMRLAVRNEEERAETFFTELLRLPIDAWSAEIARRPHERTASLVDRIIREVEIELNRLPELALQMVEIGEGVANALADKVARRCLGHCWKHRANALRHLGRYPESLDAAEIAESFYRSVPLDEFDVGQALYTRAGTLLKMTRFADALAVLTEAMEVLRPFGDSMPLAKTLLLDSVIRCDQGDVAGAGAEFQELIPMLEKFDDERELARVRTNLAECTLRLGRPADALPEAEAAAAGFTRLGMDAEAIRSRWSAAVIRLALGERDRGLEELHGVAAEFESRGMLADAGFVKLDITEELLRRQDWKDAATNARELAVLFTKAGVTLASVLALSYLAEAVEGERATPALVRYVREYVTADDPAQKFEPPADREN